MSNFSEQEKRTILQLLILIMEADSIIHPKEIDYINSIVNEFGLSSAEFDHMDMLDFAVLKNEFYVIGEEKKNIAKEYFVNLAKIDGCIHKKELDIIDSLIK